MGNLLIINSLLPEVRVALLEDGVLSELNVERKSEKGLVGNIYRGKVVRVLPGMEAAFVDVGLDKAACLYVSDARPQEARPTGMDDEDSFAERDREPESKPRIEQLLREGQMITVQVAKDPIGTKGARVTTHLSVAGRFLVYMPSVGHVGVSRRITDEEERTRLKEITESLCDSEGGFIVRTVAEGASGVQLARDRDYLIKLWANLSQRLQETTRTGLIYEDLDIISRSVRDLTTDHTKAVVIDNREDYEALLKFKEEFLTDSEFELRFFDDEQPIFDAYGISHELGKALARKVWLKSGGYIIIDQAEALTAIDVNTGRFVGRQNLEDTILKTNLEAVDEIVYQLRLRNIGGLIIIDFIDMDKPENREKVSSALARVLERDRAKTNVLRISELGLVEMTRKRVRESLGRTLTEPCFYCDGKGSLKSKTTVCYEVFREVLRLAPSMSANTIQIWAHPSVVGLLYHEERAVVESLERLSGKRLIVRARDSFHVEKFAISGG